LNQRRVRCLVLAAGLSTAASALAELPTATPATQVLANQASSPAAATWSPGVPEQLASLRASVEAIVAGKPWWYPSVLGPIAVGVVSALSGFAVAFYSVKANRASQSESRREGLIADGLKWFEHGSQRRSIGIAIIEANWDSVSMFRPLWVGVLVNQAVYLLAESSQGDAAHETQNLLRISHLLNRNPTLIGPNHRESIDRALKARNKAAEGLKLAQAAAKGLKLDQEAAAKDLKLAQEAAAKGLKLDQGDLNVWTDFAKGSRAAQHSAQQSPL
jgi:hypothetical protein